MSPWNSCVQNTDKLRRAALSPQKDKRSYFSQDDIRCTAASTLPSGDIIGYVRTFERHLRSCHGS